ncbi:hypothetical protein MPTK1_2g06130 [Marchantia polymorpha subsp. ruderalis]|uniref:Uncharacterized protein n=1 Tax=Marchantia polymorpha TaxID=3197 RepID=A0A2R6XDM5_MARPO|nr:hypothetical protein MARPO_0021s0068 [Marchantia polymorpha]BBN01279.1 hypothetical protein Mp_2g06130 [Marchantia polymorpha subsp. ruderalis]|eukprot:PTQ44204.1 hypothetical protein MARPO_0021s0068 [Marchantia polymorpha]
MTGPRGPLAFHALGYEELNCGNPSQQRSWTTWTFPAASLDEDGPDRKDRPVRADWGGRRAGSAGQERGGDGRGGRDVGGKAELDGRGRGRGRGPTSANRMLIMSINYGPESQPELLRRRRTGSVLSGEKSEVSDGGSISIMTNWATVMVYGDRAGNGQWTTTRR